MREPQVHLLIGRLHQLNNVIPHGTNLKPLDYSVQTDIEAQIKGSSKYVYVFQPAFERVSITACRCLTLLQHGGSFFTNSGGLAICDHRSVAEYTLLPAASDEGASFVGRR